jgi:hypothetical protein
MAQCHFLLNYNYHYAVINYEWAFVAFLIKDSLVFIEFVYGCCFTGEGVELSSINSNKHKAFGANFFFLILLYKNLIVRAEHNL